MAEKKKKVTKSMMMGNKELQDTLESLVPSIEPVDKDLLKLLKKTQVSKEETRIIVDNYYQIQEKRIVVESQMRSVIQEYDNTVNTELLAWSLKQQKNMEEAYFKILNTISQTTEVGKWLRKVMGIGPTLACALTAYFDIEKASSAGHFWSYAGLNDNIAPKLGKEKSALIVEKCINKNDGKLDDYTIALVAQATGRKLSTLLTKSTLESGKISKSELIKAVSYMPYNKNLKVICWKCGHQFSLLQNNEKSLYGRILRERKAKETLLNESGKYANQAKLILGEDYEFEPDKFAITDEFNLDLYEETNRIIRSKNFGKNTDAYAALSQGMLPKAQIQARAERYATKLFISHLFEKMYIDKYGKMPPNPYVIEHMGHVDYIGPEVPYIEE